MLQFTTIQAALRRVAAVWLVALVLIFAAAIAANGQDEPAPPASKERLIKTLDAVLPLLEIKDFQKAAEYFVVPPNFKPSMLDGFIERREISDSGIRTLERDATFGPAVEIFGAERAKSFADRGGVDVADCYGFYHETEAATAEVLALWKNGSFKLLRLDDVGKLSMPAATSKQPAMTQEQALQKLPGLEAAVEANPSDLAARANYAMALSKVGNFPAAWTQLMAAYQLNPSHSGIAKGIEVVWGQFEQQGLFTVGIPLASIEGVLGKPTQSLERKSGPRWAFAFYAIDFDHNGLHETIDLRGATEALFQPTEIVTVDLDGRGWRVGTRRKSANVATALLYVPGENIANWKEQVEIQRILDAAVGRTTREIAETMIAQIKAAVPDSTYKVLVASDESVTLAVKLSSPTAGDDRHQLIRLFLGPKDVHRLAYTIKGAEPSSETQQKWFAIFQSAKLESVQPAAAKPADQDK